MSEIVILSGSPSEHSRSEKILKYLGSLLEQKQFTVTHLSVRDVPPTDLFEAKFDSPAIQRISSLIENARGVIIGSPVYKAAYSGVLKALLDLLPQDVLENTPVLPVMTGGTPAHLLAIEYTLKPLIATLKGESLKGVYFLDSQIDRDAQIPIMDEELLLRIEQQLDALIEKISIQKSLLSAAL
ncbi:NADPH-dependent FMN reductase [Siminovitchia sediminis]|uniref:NADPH-dependent FMN reductase n=1 Tax=Siminovitchia sediminis TaxID=1274353 RepID=A0ABW4KLE4_9BACI